MYLHRPGLYGGERDLAFYWGAEDGAKILVKNDMNYGYNGVISPKTIIDHLMHFSRKTGLTFVNYVYGVGDHGGGPTRRDLYYALEMKSWKIFPEIEFATAKEFFERLEREGDKLPEFRGELNFEFTGCYTSQSLIKKISRYGERKLLDTEQPALFAFLLSGKEIDKLQMELNWRNILFSHFHDILPGSGVHDTRTYIHGLYQEICASAGIISTESLRRIAEKVNTKRDINLLEKILPSSIKPSAFGSGVGYGTEDGGASHIEISDGELRNFLIFNTSAEARKEVLEFVIWNNSSWNNINKEKLKDLKFSAISPDGKMIKCQTLESGHYWGHDFVKIAFPAELPSNGYSLYSVFEDKFDYDKKQAYQIGIKHHCPYAFYERSPEGLENEYIKLEIDPVSGWIKKLIDKNSGEILVSNSENPLLEYSVERPHTMTAWEIDHSYKTDFPKLHSLKRTADGPHKAVLSLNFKLEESEINLSYELRAGDPKLYINLNIFWLQRGAEEYGVPRLDFAVPVLLQNPIVEYEIPFSVIERDMKYGEDVPALRWAMVRGKFKSAQTTEGSLMLINDCKHGYSFENGVLRLSLIRSSYNPDPLPELGKHQIKLALMPYTGILSKNQAIIIGVNFNHQPEYVSTGVHHGQLPQKMSFVKINRGTAVLSALKWTEEKRGNLLIRLFNPEDKDTFATIEIKEFLGKLKNVFTCDLIEQKQNSANIIEKNGNKFKAKIAAKSFSSFIVEID